MATATWRGDQFMTSCQYVENCSCEVPSRSCAATDKLHFWYLPQNAMAGRMAMDAMTIFDIFQTGLGSTATLGDILASGYQRCSI